MTKSMSLYNLSVDLRHDFHSLNIFLGFVGVSVDLICWCYRWSLALDLA